MPRRESNTASYFPHDAWASDGDTLTVLEARFGNDGYTFWFKLLERLTRTEGHFIDCNDTSKWQVLCAKAKTTPSNGITMVDILADLKTIDPELWQSHVIWCQHLVDNLSTVYKNRNRPLPNKPILNGSNPITTNNNTIINGSSTQSRVNKIRVNKKKLYIELPDWINKEIWDAFLEMRKKTKAPPTDRAKDLLIMELEKLKTAGNDPNSVLEQSIMNNWKGVFALKGGQNGIHQKHSNLTKHYTDPDAWLRQRQAESDSPTGAGQ